jgi:beta-glucosidase
VTLRELKAFEKISLNAGETRKVTLKVPVESLGFHAEDGSYTVEAGAVQVFVGGNSLAEQVGEAEIVTTIRIPPNERRASSATGIVQ